MTFIDVVTRLFVPHESNNHKPRVLHPYAYLFYIVFFLFFGVGTRIIHEVAPNILGIATNISVSDLLTLTNQKRASQGLGPLVLNSQLSQAASQKAADMFKDNYWAHFSPSGKSPWDFIINSGYRYSFAGENLAKDFNDSQSVMNAWIASSSHRDNILKTEYKDIGLAIINGTLNGQETTLVVQMFGTTPSSTNIAQNSPEKTEITPTVSQEPTPTVEINTPVSISIPINEVYIAGVKKTPLIDINSLNKGLTLLLLSLLIIVLTLDGILIWQRKTVRISGHNFAHLIFIGALLTVIWLTGRGSIL